MSSPKPIYFDLPHVNARVWKYTINKFHINTKRYPELKDKDILVMMLIEEYEDAFEKKNKQLKDYNCRLKAEEYEIGKLKGALNAKKRVQEI